MLAVRNNLTGFVFKVDFKLKISQRRKVFVCFFFVFSNGVGLNKKLSIIKESGNQKVLTSHNFSTNSKIEKLIEKKFILFCSVTFLQPFFWLSLSVSKRRENPYSDCFVVPTLCIRVCFSFFFLFFPQIYHHYSKVSFMSTLAAFGTKNFKNSKKTAKK